VSRPAAPRAAEAIIHITEEAASPRHLVLGTFGVEKVTDTLRRRLDEVERWSELGRSADFREG